MRRILLGLLSLVAIAATAEAGIHAKRSGTLVECTTGCVTDLTPTNWLSAESIGPIIFILTGTGSPEFTLEHSAHQGVVWVTTGVSVTTVPNRSQINVSTGLYRWTVTCAGACTYKIQYHQGPGTLW